MNRFANRMVCVAVGAMALLRGAACDLPGYPDYLPPECIGPGARPSVPAAWSS